MIKPDGVERSLVGEVITRFERKGFKIIAIEMMRFDKGIAGNFYSPHVGKPFYPELEKFITSGPLVALILEGDSAIEVVRKMIGVTRSYEAQSGTIRGDLSLGVTDNVVHASDSQESFAREASILFAEIP